MIDETHAFIFHFQSRVRYYNAFEGSPTVFLRQNVTKFLRQNACATKLM